MAPHTNSSENPTAPVLVGMAPWIVCSDLTASIKFYRETLGFDGPWHWTWGEPPDHAGVSRDQTRILLVEDAERAEHCRGREMVVYVRGVAELYAELGQSHSVVQALGQRPWGTVDFTVEDPDGTRLIFTEAPDT